MGDDKIPRKTLIKLCKRLQDRLKIVEGKHASVVNKHQSVKTDADSAKAKILELQAQIEGMTDEMSTQAQLVAAQKRTHIKEMNEIKLKINRSQPTKSEDPDIKVVMTLRQQIVKLKQQLLEATSKPSIDQSIAITQLKKDVEEYKTKMVEALKYGEGREKGKLDTNPEEARLRHQISKLLEENQALRTSGGDKKRAHIASLTQQLVSARNKLSSLRGDNERLSFENRNLKVELEQLQEQEQENTGRVLFQQQEELAREKEVWTQELLRYKNKVQNLEKKVNLVNIQAESKEKDRDKLLSKHEEIKAQLTEYALKIETLQQQNQEKDRMNTELIEAHAEAKLEHEKELSHSEQKHNERYNRLLKELTSYRAETQRVLVEQKELVHKTESEMERLQEQIATGKPDERRIFELAELQARREHKIRKVNDQMKSHVQIIAQHQKAMGTYRAKIKSLTNQLNAQKLSKKRSTVNLDYLKAIMVKFIQLQDQRQAQTALYPVISRVLCFSEEEHKMVREIMTSLDGSIYQYVTSLIWSEKMVDVMRDAPAVVDTARLPISNQNHQNAEANEKCEKKEPVGEI